MTIDWVGGKYALQVYIKLSLKRLQQKVLPLRLFVSGKARSSATPVFASSTVASSGQPRFFENLIKASKVAAHSPPSTSPDSRPRTRLSDLAATTLRKPWV
ncbi:hypothetical protein FRC00_009512 [Tulasnella sp. 408]|nr:hypothetical protein FRC00_009512 [Tulasnella sp. 408]